MGTLRQNIVARLPRDERKERRILKIALAVPPMAVGIGVAGGVVPGIGVVVLLTLLVIDVLVLIYVRHLPRLIISGLVGGGLAGFVVLGAGSRLAMRFVSLTGGRREVTVEGTMFLLIAGTVFGAMVGIAIASALRVWPRRRRQVALVVGVVLALGLTLDSEAFAELLHEGAGGWLNFPMFEALPFLYAAAAVRLISRVEGNLPVVQRRHPVRVTTSAGMG